jgi:hypothetical protein
MNKILIPDAVQTSYATAFKLNTWAAVAILISALGRWYVHTHSLDAIVRGGVSLLPLIPSALYVRAIAHWIWTLDELQRRIQLEAWFFSTTGTIFVVTALNLLGASGLLSGTRVAAGLGWEGTYALAFLLWVAGCLVSNRRYQ